MVLFLLEVVLVLVMETFIGQQIMVLPLLKLNWVLTWKQFGH
jgi:hypothetical protein